MFCSPGHAGRNTDFLQRCTASEGALHLCQTLRQNYTFQSGTAPKGAFQFCNALGNLDTLQRNTIFKSIPQIRNTCRDICLFQGSATLERGVQIGDGLGYPFPLSLNPSPHPTLPLTLEISSLQGFHHIWETVFPPLYLQLRFFSLPPSAACDHLHLEATQVPPTQPGPHLRPTPQPPYSMHAPPPLKTHCLPRYRSQRVHLTRCSQPSFS